MSEKPESENEQAASSGVDDPPCSLPIWLFPLICTSISRCEFFGIRTQSQYGNSEWIADDLHTNEKDADAALREITGNGYNARKVAAIEVEVPLSELRKHLQANDPGHLPAESE